MKREHVQVTTTAATREDADRIAHCLVEKRLAACAQVLGPITSTYWWQGRIETGQEWLCVAKTRRDLYPAVETAIKQTHPYQTPEIVATPITEGSVEYLGWIDVETTE